MKAAVIVIGDELLIGQVTDTNSGMIARALAPLGWSVCQVMTVADDAAAIDDAISRSFAVAPVVLTTGGLGPTKDDITKGVLCRRFGGELRRDEEVLDNVRRVFAAKHLAMNELTAAQADVPTSCRVIPNRVGTAPVMWFEACGGRQVLVAMPGVPSETSVVFPEEVLPRLARHFRTDSAVEHRTLITYGTTESGLAIHLDSFEKELPSGVHLAYLPKDGIIRLRLDSIASEKAVAQDNIERAEARLRELTAPWLVADHDTTPAEMLLEKARESGVTIATAESCTGGNIAHRITLTAGCSDVMLGGVVAYCNDVKEKLLGVSHATLEAHGAVSEQTVREMAEGTCRATGARLGIATSGIAGPVGGSEAKPVGTVCIGASLDGLTVSHTYHFGGSRRQIIERSTTAAIMMAVRLLIDSKKR